jgi:hypothetical protein
MEIDSLMKQNKISEFKPIPLRCNCDEMVMKIRGYNYYVSSHGIVFNKRMKKITTYIDGRGYRKVTLSKNGQSDIKHIYELVAEAFIENVDNEPYIIHIDMNKKNNRMDNLKYSSTMENYLIKPKNNKLKPNNKSGYTGVSLISSSGKWRAAIKRNGKSMYKGHFKDKEDAIAAVKEAEAEYIKTQNLNFESLQNYKFNFLIKA